MPCRNFETTLSGMIHPIVQRLHDLAGGLALTLPLQAGGGLVAKRIMMNRTYDLERARDLA